MAILTTEDSSGTATIASSRAPVLVRTFRLVTLPGASAEVCFDIPVGGMRVLLGSSRACNLRVEDRHVSRRHLALRSEPRELVLHDLSSHNGTYVNGVRVTECALGGGELVRIGETTFRVEALQDTTFDVPYADDHFGRMLGQSTAMRCLFHALTPLRSASAPLLIEGEAGTGKELLAECLHEEGPRREHPFVVFDPTLVTTRDMAAVLFGVEPGTAGEEGAVGLIEQAAGGTLLIDEPVDLPIDVQRRLLRFLERGESQRVGSATPVQHDVRVITKARTDLDQAVAEGRLREDLYTLLSGVRVELPPLRARPGDVIPLIDHFWRRVTGESVAPPALQARYSRDRWPGNVRQLKVAVEAGATARDLTDPTASAPGAVADALPPTFEDFLEDQLPLPEAKHRLLAAFEAAYVARALERTGGNVTRAAAESGVAHRYFQILKAKYTSG